MEMYIDLLKDYSQKLAVASCKIDEEDLVFYALNGLPTKFNSLKTAIRARAEPIKFEELASLLGDEDTHIKKDQSSSPSSLTTGAIFTATQSHQPTTFTVPQQQSFSNNSQQSSSSNGPIFPMYSNSFSANQNKGGRSFNQNKGRGNRYKGWPPGPWSFPSGGPWNSNNQGSWSGPMSCQICGRNNHMAPTCYYRLNLAYPTPSPTTSSIPPSFHSSASSTQFPKSSPTQYSPYNSEIPPQAHFTQSTTSPDSTWFLDSGATSHVTSDLSKLSLQQQYDGTDGIMVGNGSTLPISHTGKGLLPTPTSNFLLTKMLHVPAISHNLVSVHQLARDNHCKITFDSTGFIIQDIHTNEILHKDSCHQGLYLLQTCSSLSSPAVMLSATQ